MEEGGRGCGEIRIIPPLFPLVPLPSRTIHHLFPPRLPFLLLLFLLLLPFSQPVSPFQHRLWAPDQRLGRNFAVGELAGGGSPSAGRDAQDLVPGGVALRGRKGAKKRRRGERVARRLAGGQLADPWLSTVLWSGSTRFSFRLGILHLPP